MPVPLASADLFPKIPKALRPSVSEAALQLCWKSLTPNGTLRFVHQSEMAQVTKPRRNPPLALLSLRDFGKSRSWIGTLWYSWMQIHNIYIFIYIYITTMIYVSCPASPALNRHMTLAFPNVASWDSQAAIHRHFCANARRSAGHDPSRDGWGWGSKSCDRLDESPSCFYVSSQNMYSLCYTYLSARLHNSTITHANASCYTIHTCILEASKGVIQCMTMILRSTCSIS